MNAPSSILPQAGVDDRALAELVDNLVARMQAGDSVDIEDAIREHPEHAEALRGLAPAMQMLADLGQSLSSGSSIQPIADDAAPTDEHPQLLGDFRILREVGRGGMGIVYEAEQVSLSRRVALKVLPFAAALDPRHLQRFKNEAQAAAQLHHTNVVPVHFVGCERATHFYAMQFIEGQTLAAAIADLRLQIADLKKPAERNAKPGDPEATRAYPAPNAEAICNLQSEICNPTMVALSTERSIKSQPFFRSAAQLGIQAAEALDYAHQVGIVHRDIKPANLMLECSPLAPHPSPLRLWVTDFGLAHIQHAEGALTMTGDLIGTLRYMSPEQAMAKRVIIDHRTDIYSLGATLYELLTLEPVFTGHDRQDLLRQIAFEEPRPPRKLNKDIPAELETIVMKALEKNPADRYVTAQEMADDLRHYLHDEPIRARRPRLVQRLRKWSRRHKTLVACMAVLVVTTFFMSGAWAAWHNDQQSARQRATEIGVTAAIAEAQTLLKEGDKHTDKSAHSDATVKLALSALERAQLLVENGVSTQELQSRLQKVIEEANAAKLDSNLRVELERIQLEKNVGGSERNRTPLVLRRYAAVLGSYGVDPATPAAAARRVRESRNHDILLAALEDWWRLAGHEKNAEERRRVEAVLLAIEPESDLFRRRWRAALQKDDGPALAKMASEVFVESFSAASVVILAQDLGGARQYVAQEQLLRAWRERYPTNFLLTHDLGITLWDQGRFEEAVRYLTAAVTLRSDSPGAHHHLGNALYDTGDLDGAIRENQIALKIDPKLPLVGYSLARALAEKCNRAGAPEKAEAILREAIELYKPSDILTTSQYAFFLVMLGDNLLRQKKAKEAEAVLRQSLMFRQEHEPDRWNTFNAQSKLGGALLLQKRYAEAEPLLVQGYHGMKQREAMIHARARTCLTQALERLVALDEALGQKERAQAWRITLKEVQAKDFSHKLDRSSALRQELARLYALAAVAFKDNKHQASYHDFYASTAIELLRQAVADGWRDLANLWNDNDFRELHPLADFQRLLADLQAKTAPLPKGGRSN